MIKLKIIDIKDYDYVLEDNNNKTYNLNIEFYGIKENPKVDDYIYISKKLLREKNLYSFGPFNSIYGKLVSLTEDELIKVVTSKEEFYLKRYYG